MEGRVSFIKVLLAAITRLVLGGFLFFAFKRLGKARGTKTNQLTQLNHSPDDDPDDTPQPPPPPNKLESNSF